MAAPFEGTIDRAAIIARIRNHPFSDDPVVRRRDFARLFLGDDAAMAAPTSVDLAGTDGTIVYFHGGGYSFGSPQTHWRLGHGLAERTGLRVVLPSYPLAPEQRWPAQLQAALAAVAEHPDPLFLAGDSAGGHLALVTALACARRGRPLAGLILFAPNTDRTGRSQTRRRNNPIDPMVDDAGDQALARQCFGDRAPEDVQVSPLLDELALLPPLYIEAGREEVLLDDSLLLARACRQAGGTVTLHVQPDGLHMGQLWAPWWPVACASLERAAAFARSAVQAADSLRPV